MIGQRFGRLTITGLARTDNGRIWDCRCDCGGATEARTGHLNAGNILSCGCLQRELARQNLIPGQGATHRMTRHPLYNVHRCIMRRCYNPRDKRYATYGARGITVCEDWHNDRTTFFAWAFANGYQPGLTLDRKNNDAGYSPDNCRWITWGEQQSRTTRSRKITWNGETLTVAEWAKILNVRYRALQHRINRGWSIDRIFTQPFRAPR